MEILGDYPDYVSRAEQLLSKHGINLSELKQCDTLCYECNTNERYDEVKEALVRSAKLLSEKETNGRLVSIIEAEPSLEAGEWYMQYIELLQPKPTRENIDGIDCVFFVTNSSVQEFHERHPDVPFEAKGLANKHHPYIELKGDDVAIKFHGMHFGEVVELERTLQQEK